MESNTQKVAIAYIPVLHQGYLSYLTLLESLGVEKLYIISDDILASHDELDYINRKDRLRALPHEVMVKLLQELTSLSVESLTLTNILALQSERAQIFAPREDITEFIMETYFGGHIVQYQNVFLRWNRENIGEEKEPESERITLSGFEKTVMGNAIQESEKSADWWRQVGAALVKDGEVIALSHNEHLPEPEFPNVYGDARSLFKKGVNINYVTSAHAEVGVIAESAAKGVNTTGAVLFTTDFPCPYCARLIAKSGIRKVYYLHGYAVLEGDAFLKQMGVETIKVTVE